MRNVVLFTGCFLSIFAVIAVLAFGVRPEPVHPDPPPAEYAPGQPVTLAIGGRPGVVIDSECRWLDQNGHQYWGNRVYRVWIVFRGEPIIERMQGYRLRPSFAAPRADSIHHCELPVPPTSPAGQSPCNRKTPPAEQTTAGQE